MSTGNGREFIAPVERIDEAERLDVDPLGAFDVGVNNLGDTVDNNIGGAPRFRLNFDPDERAFLVDLLAQLRDLLTSDATAETAPLLLRLFPPAFRDDPDKEAEYQRLMREELVASRVAAIDCVSALLSPAGNAASAANVTMGESELMAFMQSLNAIRLVLGTLLDITDDESSDRAELDDSQQFHLYEHLGWLLEFTVRALSGV